MQHAAPHAMTRVDPAFVLDAYHVPMLIARMVPKPDAAILCNVYLSTCHAIMRCTTWLRGPLNTFKSQLSEPSLFSFADSWFVLAQFVCEHCSDDRGRCGYRVRNAFSRACVCVAHSNAHVETMTACGHRGHNTHLRRSRRVHRPYTYFQKNWKNYETPTEKPMDKHWKTGKTIAF